MKEYLLYCGSYKVSDYYKEKFKTKEEAIKKAKELVKGSKGTYDNYVTTSVSIEEREIKDKERNYKREIEKVIAVLEEIVEKLRKEELISTKQLETIEEE